DKEVRPLDPNWAGLVAALWEPEWPAEGYVRRRIEAGPTAAVYDGGRPVAWALTHMVTDRVGIIGMVHVLEAYRRKGLARAVVSAISQDLIRAGKTRQKELWQAIRAASKHADVLTVSHYHYDHHNPDAPSIFRGKIAFLKDGKFHINRSQRQRAGAFVRAIKKCPKEMQVADGNQMDFGGTELLFSPALPHGYDDQLGYVVMTRIAQGDEVFVHTADVLGPPLKEHLSFLIDAQPTVLYVDGP